ncbi:CaiB/BaiF CoA-transferase family protein [Motiliproteus sp. MSK22-1]|uniref:CaiB/BaiF CoA transferase family protein n=1 Tax=Motiliproteus sp. MSK22-1 TaxID=1897630 RepID=UPI0009767C6C|nr:CaiB/BaiF CoA-transferase family protein [Motiliproteus sp. MSK22-1]OMH33969.1 CoA-transferase [Motiliproteus sp. MSK22-1]
MSGALDGYRVLDLSRILAGPWAGQMLADFGAEVIKVERPGRGDDTRGWGPPYVKGEKGEDTQESAYFHSANRGKRSLTIDLSHSEGQALVRELVAECDVLLENYKVDGLKKYGLDYDSLQQINPGLVYCSITGFGQTGPYRQRAGYDFMIQGMGGLMSLTGEAEGMPIKVGVALTDVMTGLYAANAVMAALLSRAKTGQGQHIDLALLDVQVATLANQAMNYLVSKQTPQRLGNAHPNIVPYQAFATQDSHIILAVGNDAQFSRFAELVGYPEWGSDERYRSNNARVLHRESLVALIAACLQRKTSADWLKQLNRLGIPCGPINSLDQVFNDSQVQARGMVVQLSHQQAGSVPSVANPIRFSNTPISYQQASPLLGEYSEQVLRDILNKDDKDIRHLKESGII